MDIELGEIDPFYDYDFLKERMKAWANTNDIELAKEHNGDYKLTTVSEKFKQIFNTRLFTHEEYLRIFVDIPQSDYKYQPAYLTLELFSKADKDAFLLLHGKSESDYSMVLQNQIKDQEDFFLLSDSEKRWMTVQLKCHTHIRGKTGEGKSYFIKLHMYETWKLTQDKKQTSLCLIDIHGQLAKEIKNLHLNLDNDRLVYIAPSFKKGWTPTLNLMEIKNQEYANTAAEYVTEALLEMIKDDTTGQMENILHMCIYAIMKKGDGDLKDVSRLIQGDKELVKFAKSLSNEEHRNFFLTEFEEAKQRRREELFIED